MSIPDERLARDMDLKKAVVMGLGECHVALREAYSDLTDAQFQGHPVSDRHNIVTIVMHCLQQLDDFNANLQALRDLPARHEWRFIRHERRFALWGLSDDELPKPGDPFPTVAEVAAIHDELLTHLFDNLAALTEEDLTDRGVEPWPRLCDIFFRAIWHTQAHIRQIWLMRGLMGLTAVWPEQHYA